VRSGGLFARCHVSYILPRPNKASYTLRGLLGYSLFGNKRFDIDYIDVVTGHDTFHISKRITRLYYVLSGTGYYIIEGRRYDVEPAELVAIPPRVEYSYSGQMTLLMMATPRWARGTDIITRWNLDVVSGGTMGNQIRRPWLSRVVETETLGISPLKVLLRLIRAIWKRVPRPITNAVTRTYKYLAHRNGVTAR
jgi:mannose-6-phosphate isomerase-like protein (cupin superfamily)